MPDPKLTSLARIPNLLLTWAVAQGVDRDRLLRESHLSEEDLRDADSRVSVRKTWNLARAIGRRITDPGAGVRIGREIAIRELGLVGYAMFHSETLRDAFERLVRYGRLLNEVSRGELSREGANERLVLHTVEAKGEPPILTDARLAAILAAARTLTGREIVPVEVGFAHAAPDDLSDHREFFRASLQFECPRSEILFRGTSLDLPVMNADETLSRYLDRLAEKEVKPFVAPQSFAKRVEWALWQELSRGGPTLERIAGVLGVSPRTLQRRLRNEGSSFAAELEYVRRRMSSRLLADGELAVYEVAFLLGYSEPSTFFRAFRRWHGTTPKEYRERRPHVADSSPSL